MGYFYPIDSKKGQIPLSDKLSIETKMIEIDGKQRHYAIAFFKPDEYAILGEGADVTISITISFTPRISKFETKYSSELMITRPPIMLMHGVWASTANFVNRKPDCNFSENISEDVFRSLEQLVGPYNVILGNYESSNAREFGYNIVRVKDQIDQAMLKYRSEGGAISRIDYVGHSMGGILGRMAASESPAPTRYLYGYGNNSSIRKLITIGTPHFGSATADFRQMQIYVDWLFAVGQDMLNAAQGMPSDQGAIDDLVSGSQALQGLMATRDDVKCHAIASNANPNDVYVWDNALNWRLCIPDAEEKIWQYAVEKMIKYRSPQIAAAIIVGGETFIWQVMEWGIRSCGNVDSILIPYGFRNSNAELLKGSIPCIDMTSANSFINTLFFGEMNDRVVSVRSQFGGIVGGRDSKTLIDNGPNHTDESGDGRIGRRLVALLDTADQNLWGSFPQVGYFSEVHPCLRTLFRQNSVSTDKSVDLISEQKSLKSVAGNSVLEVLRYGNSSNILQVNCVFESKDPAFVQVMFQPRIPGLLPSLHSVTSGVPLLVEIPNKGEGRCIVMLKQNSNRKIHITQKEIYIGTTAKFGGFSVPKRDVVIDSLGQARPLGIFGTFSDGVERSGVDVLRGAAVSIIGEGSVQIGDDGLVRGLRNGVCEVKLTRDGMSASVFMTVDAPTPKLFAAVVDGALSTKENLVVKLVGQNLNAITNIATMTNGVSDLGTRFISVQSNPSGTEAEARFAVTYGDLWRDVDLFVMNGAGKDDYEQRGGVPVSIGFGPLSIGVVNDIDGAQLVWPGLDSGFMLENSSDLSDNKKWNLCTEVYMIGNGYGKYRVSPSEAQRFFRVRKIN